MPRLGDGVRTMITVLETITRRLRNRADASGLTEADAAAKVSRLQ